MTELSAEQALIEKIAQEGANVYLQTWEASSLQEQANWCYWVKDRIMPLIEKALPELAKEAGYVLLGKYDLVVKKPPVTGIPEELTEVLDSFS